jgi:thiol-disulfide isomerase/thioredoxin
MSMTKYWHYTKSIVKGVIIAVAVILLYTLMDFIYFNNQLVFADYIDTIKLYVVALSIVLYLNLLYIFYSGIKDKRKLDFILLASPYLLTFLIANILSSNIPRTIDLFYLCLGTTLVFFKFKENSFINNRKYVIIIFYGFVVLTYPYVYENINYNYHKNKPESVKVERELNFTLTDIHNLRYKLSDFKSKTVCIDMWSSTCGGCIRSMPEFEELNLHFKNNPDYKIISLFCPMKEHQTYEWFLNYIKEDFNYNIDYYYIDRQSFKKLGIYQFPEFILVNKNNRIVYRGLVTYKQSTFDNIYDKLEKINANE